MKNKIFKQPLFWTQLASVIIILFLVFVTLVFSTENTKLQKVINKDKDLNNKFIVYTKQMNSDPSFYDTLMNFATATGENQNDFKKKVNYSSGNKASADISVLYARKDDSGLLATGIDTSKNDVFLVGVDIVNTSDIPIEVNPKEFFLKSNEDYLTFDSTFVEGGTLDNDKVVVPSKETKTIVNFYGGEKNKHYNDKNLKVQYGAQFWR